MSRTVRLAAKQSKKCDDGGRVLLVSGDGQFCIRYTNTNSKRFDNILLDFVINKNNLDVPMSVFLSQEQADSELEITTGKNIRFNVREITSENKSSFARKVCQQNDLDLIKSACGELENNNRHKTHRRNNSDFLHVVGKDDLNIEGSIEDNENITPNSDDQTLLVKTPEENSSSFSACSGRNDEISDNLMFGNAKNEIVIDSCLKNKQKHDCVINGNSKSENLPHQRPGVNSLPRQFSFSKTLQFNGKNRLSLKEAIRKYYTYLLDVLDVLEFCDNLYQNYVIDISFYQKLFEMCFDPRQVRSAKRELLMHLSTKTVEKDNLIDALYGSAQYQLVPFFYPDAEM